MPQKSLADRAPLVVVAIIVGVAIVILFLVILLSRLDLSGSGPGSASFDRGQRFKAEAGKERENAMALTSSKRSQTRQSASGRAVQSSGGGDGQIPINVPAQNNTSKEPPLRSLSLSNTDNEDTSQAQQLARSALNSINPDKSLKTLEGALREPQTPADATTLYTALGDLYTRQQPPNFTKADEAYRHALGLAPDAPARRTIVKRQVHMLMQRGQADIARIKILESLKEPAPPSTESIELGMLLGNLYHLEGKSEEAVEAYESALNTGLSMKHADSGEAVRMVGMQLSQIYAEQDEVEKRDALVNRLKDHARN